MARQKSSQQQFRYLPEEPEDQVWGIFLRDLGAAEIQPDAPYPPPGHPAGYAFGWDEGRVLEEFQIIVISRGHGVLETRTSGRHYVRAGQAFVLFPREWHRYRPAVQSGWRELWVGFSGDYAGHLMRQFFSARQPVVALGDAGKVSRLLEQLVQGAGDWGSDGARAMMRVRLLELIAQLRRSRQASARPEAATLESARLEILTHATERMDWKAMARRYGMGYATFRRRFKEMTGRSPLDYQIQVRLNRAVEMLATGELTAREISERLGYAHVHFFSRQFKKRFGRSPQLFRERLESGRKSVRGTRQTPT